jgi:hypothetical protein
VIAPKIVKDGAQRGHVSYIESIAGETPDLGKFQIRFSPSEPDNVLSRSFVSLRDDTLHGGRLVEAIMMNTGAVQVRSEYFDHFLSLMGGAPVPNDEQQPPLPDNPNFAALQLTILRGTKFDIVYESGSFANRPNRLVGKVYDEELEVSILLFYTFYHSCRFVNSSVSEASQRFRRPFRESLSIEIETVRGYLHRRGQSGVVEYVGLDQFLQRLQSSDLEVQSPSRLVRSLDVVQHDAVATVLPSGVSVGRRISSIVGLAMGRSVVVGNSVVVVGFDERRRLDTEGSDFGRRSRVESSVRIYYST